ncbi:MAG: hypothetical protein HUU35_15025, partial [Armatimonadetes bacterium]|nr:hypothetical protein [Armatimonadota bacterium]
GYATCASALISPAGQPAERLALTDLTPGTAVALVGKDNKTSVAARLVWVDRPPSIPERIENLLEEAIEAIVR